MRKYKDEDVLVFIKNYMMEKGYAPSIREIGNGLGLKSTSSVHHHFDLLVQKGEIIQNGKRYTVKGMKYVDGESHAEDV